MTSEFELIRRHFSRTPRQAVLGAGDDCALVRVSAGAELAISTDMLVEGRHFAAGADPRSLGHKSLAVNLSDMAAMGATPAWATLALALPRADEKWVGAFAKGLYALADRHEVDVIGGDTTRGPLTICITIFGEIPQGLALYRAGARAGDDIWVSGALGGAALALARPRPKAAAKRLHEPEPRVELGERLRGVATSAIDVSDGFAQDLGHILERSSVGAMVHYERLPQDPALRREDDAKLVARCVLAGGDDYELVFTAPPAKREEIEAIGAELKLALTQVGSIQKGGSKLHLLGPQGKPMLAPRGFDHFRA
jgi:thiamine-monophosphate kinase